MLKKLEVQNFKNFEHVVLDFGNVGEYNFNEEIIKNGIISRSLVLGQNASGKSNIGLAIFDIVIHLTDKNKKLKDYNNYLNYNLKNLKSAEFCYTFKFNDDEVKYEYKKIESEVVIEEKLFINNELCLEYNKEKNIIQLKIERYVNNFENFNTEFSVEDFENISLLKYVKGNTLLIKNGILEKFFYFVNNMLWIRSLQEGNSYMGYRNGSQNIMKSIIEADKVKDFEKFLKKFEINQKLVQNDEEIFVEFENGKKVRFYEIASSGTKILALLFLWMEVTIKNVSFLFIDEFDAYFHYKLSRAILENLLKSDKIKQLGLSSHSTALIDNEILRPDCYFILNNKGNVKQLSEISNQKLEEYHNIEKMYRAEVFDYE